MLLVLCIRRDRVVESLPNDVTMEASKAKANAFRSEVLFLEIGLTNKLWIIMADMQHLAEHVSLV